MWLKRLFLLLFIVLSGCEYYIEPSNIHLNVNGSWTINEIQPSWSGGNIKVLDDTYFAQSPFIVVGSTNNGTIIIKNDITNIEPCFFYKKGYTWEFDYYTLLLKDNTGNILRKYYITIGNNAYNFGNFTLTDQLTLQPIPGTWHMTIPYLLGSYPSQSLLITVPDICFNIQGVERMVCQSVTLVLTR